MEIKKFEKDGKETIFSGTGHIDTLVRKDMPTKKPLVYPPVVIAHITSDITDLFIARLRNKSSVQVHYSAQMNSHPHLGTITSLMAAFAVSERLAERFKIPIMLKFEALENAPKDQKIINGLTYAKMHCGTYLNGTPLSEVYLASFRELLEILKKKSGVDYSVLYYKQLQEIPFVRRTLLEMIDRKDEFTPIVAPSEENLRIRFPCPECGFAEKSGAMTTIKERKGKYDLIMSSKCHDHGNFEIELKPESKDFVDMNVPIRNIIKEAMFIEQAKAANALNLMVDGSDWVHIAEFIVSEGLSLLGYNYGDRPTRLFTPMIEDWSGAKFSKSVYIQQGTYDMPEGFLNFVKFKEEFGDAGLNALWEEARSWASDPKKLFRNYSAEYLMHILRK